MKNVENNAHLSSLAPPLWILHAPQFKNHCSNLCASAIAQMKTCEKTLSTNQTKFYNFFWHVTEKKVFWIISHNQVWKNSRPISSEYENILPTCGIILRNLYNIVMCRLPRNGVAISHCLHATYCYKMSMKELEFVADFIVESFIHEHEQLKVSGKERHFNLDKVCKFAG